MKRRDDERAFLLDSRDDVADALAAELAIELLEKLTSGEDGGVETRDAFYEEEIGGPFVTSTGGEEFADDVDESNPPHSRREPFPRT
jgi:hypothetical protein